MQWMTYGEIVADRIREARAIADGERLAARRSIHSTPVIGAWRIASGRLLVSLGERLAGCAALARSEARPNVRLVG
ncbi:MAG TPA: hypothetical protein VNG93_08960 [Candidatus Dormibacteraeota bacterium]|nr:hypothetical protein [Candidatus Dormibacteraeota bacterium]